jgi:multisubunit Na+/H+ antiporter MnhF subunit
MIDLVLLPAFLCLAAAIVLGLFRVARGPGVLNRVLAFDLFSSAVVGIIILLSLQWRTAQYLELILIFSLLGFLTTVAFVLYLHKTIKMRSQQPPAP